jgi:probable phosphoglycerate mutase
VTTFHLVRHAAHDLIGRVLVGRSVDVPLNAEGRNEARSLVRRLAREAAARVLSSPRRRARETAAPIAAALGLGVELAVELDEHDCGMWSGQHFDGLAADPHWRSWNERRGATRPPGGESMAELQARIVGYLHELRDRHGGSTLVLVSHAEPIRAALAYARGIALEDVLRVDVPVGSVVTLAVDRIDDLRQSSPAVIAERGAA